MNTSRLLLALGITLVSGATACAAILGLDEGTPRDLSASADGGSSGLLPDGGLADGGVVAAPASYGDVTDPSRWQTYDLSAITGASGQAGAPGDGNGGTPLLGAGAFVGAIFDGHAVTYVPHGTCGSGMTAAYDPTKPFGDPGSWSVYDLSGVSSSAHGFFGGAFDGKKIHFVPDCNVAATGDYSDGVGVSHDVSAPLDAGWTTFALPNGGIRVDDGWRGAAFDGTHVYFAPARTGAVDRWTTLADASVNVETFDTTTITPAAGQFTSAVFDGRFMYFVPGGGACSTVLARYDTQADFATAGSWTSFDVAKIGPSTAGWCGYGGVFDGRALILVPASSTVVVRLDVGKTFGDAASWAVFDLAKLDPNADHFAGGAFDGRFTYLVPSATSTDPSTVFRVDGEGAFTDPSAWSAFDLASRNGDVTGFAGGAFDGRWIYLAPAGTKPVAARFDARSPSALPPTYRGSFL